MIPILYLLFFLSGAAGLMYESVWARYLGLFVGHEAYAQVLVLVIFLGGMALGSALVARRADSCRNPLRLYALVEGAVGLFGMVFHPVFVASTDWAYGHAFPALGEGVSSLVLQWGLAAVLILPQSILLGMTFPLMSAGILRLAPREPGSALGWLYASNSLGAALGVLVSGFALIAIWGLPGVSRTAGALNLFVAVAILALLSGPPDRARPAPVAQLPATSTAVSGPRLTGLLLGTAFLTAVASFCYEIDWIRMLSLLLGSATHSFELMLSAFILGLALGAFWIRRRIDRLKNPVLTLAAIQVAMGTLAVATLPVYGASFAWMANLLEALAPTSQGYAVFSVVRYGFCLAVMLPATFCAGMTLPLITRILLVESRSESAIGRVYAANTLGSIIGASLAALVLLPVLGLRGLLVLGGLIDIGLGGILLFQVGGRSPWRLVPLGLAALCTLGILMLPLDRRRLVSGVFRSGSKLQDSNRAHLDYYEDGRTATVALLRAEGGFLSLITNGKVDASRSGEAQRHCDPKAALRQMKHDEITQLLTGILPLAYLGREGDAVMVGMGSGLSTHFLLASPLVRSVITVEIEPHMVEAARLFDPANRRTFEDRRSRIVIGDARAFLGTANRRFDLIVSEPSNPWVSGVSSLFTEEFYRLVSAHLAADGVFVQWLQTYELDDESVLRVLAAIAKAFPDWQVHQAGPADILIVATPAQRLPPGRWDQVASLPLLQADLCGVIPLESTTLEETFLADRTLLAGAVSAVGAPNSDYYPILDLRAERRRFEVQRADGVLALGDDWFNYSRQLMNRPGIPVASFTQTFEGMRRSSERYLQTWQSTDPPDNQVPTRRAAQARYEWEGWRKGLLSGEAPPDWKSWLDDFHEVGKTRHAGAAGWADAGFFLQAEAFAQAHQAPPVVRDIIRFRRAVQTWDATMVLEEAERLADSSRASVGWIFARDLLDPAVIAAATLGRPDVAQAWLTRFAHLADRSPDDIRSRILTALASAH